MPREETDLRLATTIVKVRVDPPSFTSSSSFSNNTNRSPASNGNDGDDEQQVSEPIHLLTLSPFPVVASAILCGSSLFWTQVYTPGSGVSTSWVFLYPSTSNPGLLLEHQLEYSGTHVSVFNLSSSSTSSYPTPSWACSRTGRPSGFSLEIQQLVIDINPDENRCGEEERVEGEEIEHFAEDERGMEVNTHDFATGTATIGCKWMEGVHTNTEVGYE